MTHHLHTMIQELAISENDNDTENLLLPTTNTLLNRRRSSVRSRYSILTPASNSISVTLNQDFQSDLTRRTIQDFKEINTLGVGAYGIVYLVKDKYTNKLYAKKTIKKAKISIDSKLYKNSKNERDILSNISHPNIVKLFYSFHDDQFINFILEYIPGGEIFYHLRSKSTFDEYETSFYLAEISLALIHLHKVGIVYRDLKPENCLLNSKGHVVLTDFGLSSMEETCHSILGTPQFTAPEVIKGEAYSYPADWWSFGIMMYDMLTGDTPFTNTNKAKVLQKLVKFKKLENIPHYLSNDAKHLLYKLTQVKPEKRLKVDSDNSSLFKDRFFRKIDWENISQMKAPIIPDVSDLELAKNFDHEYIRQYELHQLRSKDSRSESFDNEMFNGFSFTASEKILSDY